MSVVLNARLQSGRSKKDGRIKVGHGGTLDKDAEGVLVLGIGKGTTMLSRYLQGDKVVTGLLYIVHYEPTTIVWMSVFPCARSVAFGCPSRYMHEEFEK
jgi:hypothetical protein